MNATAVDLAVPDSIDLLEAQIIARDSTLDVTPERRHVVALFQMLAIANAEAEACTALVRELTRPTRKDT